MDNLIRVYENVISDTDCDKLIERFEDNRQLYQNFDDISGQEALSNLSKIKFLIG